MPRPRPQFHLLAPLHPVAARGRTSAAAILMVLAGAGGGLANLAQAQCVQETLTAPDMALDNAYGQAVDVDGAELIVGSSRDQADGPRTGAAWIHLLEGTSYTGATRLTPPDGIDGAGFGTDVAIEGNLALVGAPEQVDAGTPSGRAYLYRRVDGEWTFERSFVTPGIASTTDRFGAAVAIADQRLFIGAPGHLDLGSAFIWELDPDTEQWTLVASLLGTELLEDGANGTLGEFIDANGSRMVLAAPTAEKVFVLSRDPRTAAWTTDAILEEVPKSSTPSGFGRGVSIDGSAVVVASPFDDEAATNAGAVTVFRRDDGGTWDFEDKLFASDASSFAVFGAGCGISCDTIVTSRTDRGYVFQRQGDTWVETAIILPPEGGIGGTLAGANQLDVSGDVAILGNAGFFNVTGRAHVIRGLGGRDCNGNGMADSCEIIEGLVEDLDGNGIPDGCTPGDLDADGLVGISDLLAMLAEWGPCDDDCDCPPDLDGDGSIGIADLLTVLANWTS